MSDDARRWHIATVPHARDSAATPQEVGWDDLTYTLTHARPHPGPPEDKATKERIPGWIPARIVPDAAGEFRRKSENAADVTCLVLDLDNGEPLTLARQMAVGWRAVFHTSWSHAPGRPKGRLVFPLAAPCPVARWAAVWRSGARWAATFGLTVDPAVKDPCRLYFLPASPTSDPRRAAWFHSWVNEAPSDSYMHWRWLLAGYPDPAREDVPRPVLPTLRREHAPGGEAERRSRYAQGILRRRIDELSRGAEGGRNLAAFRAGAVLGQLDAAGVVNADSIGLEFVRAAMQSGLSESEADTAIRNGIARGRRDGPFPFPR